MPSRKKKSNSSRSSAHKTPSPTAQILEHVELLVALHEEQYEPGGSSTASDTTALVDDISQKLESQLVKRFDLLEDQLASSDSKHDNNDSNVDSSSLESILERFDSLESKLTAIEDQARDPDGPQLSATKIQERFEAFDNRLQKITTAIEGQQQLIEKQNLSVESSDFDTLKDEFSKMLNQMKNEMGNVAEIQPNSEQLVQNEDEPTTPDWGEQKQAMLSKYGIDPEHRPDMAPPTAPDPVLETTMADEQLSASVELSVADNVPNEDSEEIQKVKQELNAKLRDAEVELSIERAKLSQLEAELESKQIELDRRDLELTQKFGRQQKNNSVKEEDGLLDRLKKHLTAKDRKSLDRI